MKRLGTLALGLVGLVLIAAVWEIYKALGPEKGVLVGGRAILPRTSDRAMPHVWEMVTRLGGPAVGRTGDPLWLKVLDACGFSLRIAAVGLLIGLVVGLGLALVMQRVRLLESAILPWIVLSQTVPLIAIAPLVRRWGSEITVGSFEWSSENSVAVIAAYLAFFPVAVGMLRGLKAPDQTHLDLMRTYGTGWWATLVRLRLPASVPYLLPAVRLAAASAVIGTVVAEVSIGLRGGIGRLIIEYAQSAGGDAAKPWAPIFGAIAIGLIAAGFVGLVGLLLRPYRRSEAPA
ncbi:MAG TPA: ABC transporter permease subunit [Propionibacteriaceae bacterium]